MEMKISLNVKNIMRFEVGLTGRNISRSLLRACYAGRCKAIVSDYFRSSRSIFYSYGSAELGVVE